MGEPGLARVTLKAPRRPATLGRAFALDARVGDFGGAGRAADAFGGAIKGGLCITGAGGFANLGGSGMAPIAAASELRGGFGGGFRDACCGRSGLDIYIME